MYNAVTDEQLVLYSSTVQRLQEQERIWNGEELGVSH